MALHEPISPELFSDLDDPESALRVIQSFEAESRQRLLADGVAPSKQMNGEIPSNPVAPNSNELRKEIVSLGLLNASAGELLSDFMLLIKHNALFTALLPRLSESYTVFGIVRNPLAILCSWQTVDLPVHLGRVPMGEKFDPVLRVELDRTRENLTRQLIVLRWFFRRFRLLPDDRILKYEDIIRTGGSCLGRITGQHDLQDKLDPKLTYSSITPSTLDDLRHGLLDMVDVFQPWYSSSDINDHFDLIHDVT